MRLPRITSEVLVIVAVLVAAAPECRATWSIVMADEATGEVALASVTCLEGLDLLAFTPALVVGRGAACAQASSDFDGVRRQLIMNELAAGTSNAEILALLSEEQFHQRVQYGLVSTYDGALTYTGPETEPWTGGVIGQRGTLHYAIQGNSLVGPCVLAAIEEAIQTTMDDLPGTLMAAMAAARDAGGDGRCSCSMSEPDSCACPPAFFQKSGHVGGLIVARLGDVDDPDCNPAGCTDGDYFMRLDAGGLVYEDPDPVTWLQEQFDDMRVNLEGRPDAVQSLTEFDEYEIPPDGVSTATMTISLRDWRGLPLQVPMHSVTVEHAPNSAGRTTIGPINVIDLATFEVTVTAGTAPGIDRFKVTIDDWIRPVQLMPVPVLKLPKRGDFDGDGDVDFRDFQVVAVSWGRCALPPQRCISDLNGDGYVGLADMIILLGNWG